MHSNIFENKIQHFSALKLLIGSTLGFDSHDKKVVVTSPIALQQHNLISRCDAWCPVVHQHGLRQIILVSAWVNMPGDFSKNYSDYFVIRN